MELHKLICFVEEYFNVPVHSWPKENLELERFERQHCFSRTYQPRNTASYLQQLTNTTPENTLLELREPLGTILLFFSYNNHITLIGPFTEASWNIHTGESALADVGLSVSELGVYKIYFCSYHVRCTEHIIRALRTLMIVERKVFDTISYQRLTITPPSRQKKLEHISEERTFNINERYQNELAFMDAVRRGDKTEALILAQKMRSYPHRSSVRNTTVQQATGLAQWRTMCRLAASQSGLSPITVDAIVQEHLQKLEALERGRTIHNPTQLVNSLVGTLCDEVREFHQRIYPTLARNAMTYIKLNLGRSLSPSSIARQLNIPPAYLSKQFKAATGMSVTQYIQTRRMQKASELLRSSSSTIQDISSYVGYQDNNYFIKVFKRHHGTTPSEYRNRYQM
ncbi:AraC family transcriptional regulator [Lachnospiraceae bacterium OttesenSCG-928-D06]|nr:AraC family transcriptional regulator [Lachnospiraceae bacterium OttesenSCG-928-D06]